MNNLDNTSIELVEPEDVHYLLSHNANYTQEDGIPVENDTSYRMLYSSQEPNHYRLSSSVEEFDELLRQHEVESYTKYIVYKTNGVFKGKGKDPVRKPRVHWGVLSKVSPTLASTPYLIVGTRYYVCHLGKCYYTTKLQKYSTQRDEDNRKRYKKVTSSKKVGCPANFKVQRLIVFPDNKLDWDTPSERARMGDFIRKNISSIRIEHKYLFKFPDPADHENHMQQHVAAGKEPIDKRVSEKIKELVYNGQTSVLAVAESLEEFVETQIKFSDKNRRRFFPPKVDIQRVIHKSKLSLRKSKNDQEKVEALICDLGSPTEVFFQPSNYDIQGFSGCHWNLDPGNLLSRKSGLLFVYQSAEMRRLYQVYGHLGLILDPTFCFCKYSFPFYFLAVQTNVNYQIVAFFITEFETKEAILEALTIISHWNPTVVPKFALTNNNSDQIKALETVFPEIKVFIASYYCEASWKQRLLRKDMHNVNRVEALSKWNAIKDAATEDKLQKAINELKAWPHPLFKEVFEKSWQKEIKRWGVVYRPSDLLCESNEAVNRLDEEFKYMALSQMKDFTLSQMVCELCKSFIPKSLQQYNALNQNVLGRHAAAESYIPSYLLGSPQWILDAVVERIILADQSLSHSYVEHLSDGHYSLLSKNSNTKYSIKFDVEQKQVTCTCFHFLKRRVICKHAIIVGRFYPQWNIEKISDWVFDFPIFKVDNLNLDIPSSNFLKRESECEIHLEGEDDTLHVNSVERGIASSAHHLSIKERCKQSLKSLEAMVQLMSSSQLDRFYVSLKDFSSEWSGVSRISNKVISPLKPDEEDIPLPFIKKISDFYKNKEESEKQLWKSRRPRKRLSKRAQNEKLIRRNKKRLKKNADKEDINDIKTCNITTFHKVEKSDVTIPLFTVKVEGEEPSDPTEELETHKEVIEEYFDGENNVVILINNPEEELVQTDSVSIFSH